MSRYKDTKKWREKNRWFRPLEFARRRCTDPQHKSYKFYGGRGIKCDLTAAQAKELYERDCGDLLDKPSLDRQDPDGHYTFDNCRYIEHLDNIKNCRRNKKESISCENPNEGEWEE